MKKMSIYEPAMCCSTGLCGVGVDSELLRISTIINTLKKNGVEVERYNLSNAPQEFISNSEVNEFINKYGADKLPVTVLDGKIVVIGRYPTNEELKKFLELSFNLTSEKTKASKITLKKTDGCGCSDGKCC
jgi:Arsenical resistance operon protein ArsD